jgi:hypothetical protein
MQSTATIHTTAATRYLGQFCKHFAHKLPVDLDPANASGQVTFDPGAVCRLSAGDDTLTLNVIADTAEQIARLQDVTVRHLVRFAFREELTVNWGEAG